MKPTELEPNHVIYVGDSGKVLYDSDYKPIVKIKIVEIISNSYDYYSLFEFLENGTITKHSLKNISANDIIELSPCRYGFCFARNGANKFNLDGSFISYSPTTKIDITNYDTSKITDFSGMFLKCNKAIGIENLNTSNGVRFDSMFYMSNIRAIPINLSCAQSVDLRMPIRNISNPLDFTGSIICDDYQAILNKTNYFFEYVYKDFAPNILTKKIICDNKNFATFVHLCAIKQGYTFEFVKPNGEAWSFE